MTIFVNIPDGTLIYSIAGLVIFAGFWASVQECSLTSAADTERYVIARSLG